MQIDPPPGGELDSFSFQQMPLQLMRVGCRARADLAGRVHDAVPRKIAGRRKVMQRVADLPGVTVQSGERCDLTVRGHSAPWDASHDGIDPVVRSAHSLVQSIYPL